MSQWKDRFHLTGKPYFLSHSVGLMPLGAAEHLSQVMLQPWRQNGQSWDIWWDALETFRKELATFLNTDAEMVCPQTNVSSALTKILFALPEPDSRNVLLLSEQDFPTIGFVAQQARRCGWRVRYIHKSVDLTDAGAWDHALASDVGAVVVTHVYSNSSQRAPVAEIVAAARKKGITSIIDAAQSIGCVPVDQTDWQADFIIGTSVKYLCGGPGAAWLAIRSDMVQRCRPLDVGWFSHENPFEFDIKEFRYAPDARRFWGGTPAVAPYTMAGYSLQALGDIGIEAIDSHNQGMLDQLIDGLDNEHIRSETRAGKRGCALLYQPPEMEKAAAALKEAGISHDTRDGALRLSVHLYNGHEDIDAAVAALTG